LQKAKKKPVADLLPPYMKEEDLVQISRRHGKGLVDMEDDALA
jgi:hypothetical protein